MMVVPAVITVHVMEYGMLLPMPPTNMADDNGTPVTPLKPVPMNDIISNGREIIAINQSSIQCLCCRTMVDAACLPVIEMVPLPFVCIMPGGYGNTTTESNVG